ncbi:MAG: hypothetical protein KBC22_02950, partial [Candidatus Pacebacteria bacterium]|nr:hypothetical protein [Candidatus Paceibacterota bacterium]
MKKSAVVIISLIIVIALGYVFVNTSIKGPQKIKLTALEITNVYRDCTKMPGGNFRDTTIQTTINVEAGSVSANKLKITANDVLLKIGPNKIEGFSLNKIPTPEPYTEGIEGSGLHMITG